MSKYDRCKRCCGSGGKPWKTDFKLIHEDSELCYPCTLLVNDLYFEKEVVPEILSARKSLKLTNHQSEGLKIYKRILKKWGITESDYLMNLFFTDS